MQHSDEQVREQAREHNHNMGLLGRDPQLAGLVMLLDQERIDPFYLNLTVGGLLVSGEAVGLKGYYQELAKVVQKGQFSDRTRKDLTGGCESAIEMAASDIRSGDTDPVPVPIHIHLRHVRIWHGVKECSPGGELPGVLWRGKLSAIDGFTLG